MKLLVTGGSGFIGTNLVEHFLDRKIDLISLDLLAPKLASHTPHWVACDLLEAEKVQRIVDEVQPTHVIHLAARTDTDGTTLEDYRANTDGTANLLDAIRRTGSVERVVITSSQFVCGPGELPQHDQDFRPHTVYGQSKVLTEHHTREAALGCGWTIIRPTNIWGPWHPRYPYEFWRVLQRGWYVHPGQEPVIRCYGYVKNVVSQIEAILRAPGEQAHEKVFYVGDRPIELREWVNGFSEAITGKEARVVPRGLFRMLALTGDVVTSLGAPFPIHSSRFKSMTQDYVTPMEPVFEAFGAPPFTMQEGIEETVAWLRQEGFL